MLIVYVRHDDLRLTALCSGGRGTRTAVMDDSCDLREQLIVVDIADRDTVSARVDQVEIPLTLRND